MKNNPINIDMFFVLKKTMARVVIHMEMKAKDSKGGLTEVDPPEMIVGTAPHFN
jgi:hypothetical protein